MENKILEYTKDRRTYPVFYNIYIHIILLPNKYKTNYLNANWGLITTIRAIFIVKKYFI